jgi:hypothetical protein
MKALDNFVYLFLTGRVKGIKCWQAREIAAQ